MKLKNIIDINKSKPAVIALHGPSLQMEKIEKLQKEKKILRFSVNNYFDFFNTPPDFWVFASTCEGIFNYSSIMEHHNIPVLYAKSVDIRDYDPKNYNFDFIGFDQRHFQGHKCGEIINNMENNGIVYGNNTIMNKPPREDAGLYRNSGPCCQKIDKEDKTIQETLMDISGYHSHYSTGDTVALHCLAIAIIMGCSPIYISGLDLSYDKGYYGGKSAPSDFWKTLSENLINDLTVINKSAKMRDVKIINTLENAWYGVF